jgi:hypothetical protein
MHDFLYTNDFKDFTLETAARNPPAGAGARQSMFANGKVDITPFFFFFFFFFLFCGLRNLTFSKG